MYILGWGEGDGVPAMPRPGSKFQSDTKVGGWAFIYPRPHGVRGGWARAAAAKKGLKKKMENGKWAVALEFPWLRSQLVRH